MRSLTTTQALVGLGLSGLLILADSITNIALASRIASSESSPEPGQWNTGTLSIIISGLSDVVGQFCLGYLADRKGHASAVLFNALSISLASAFCLFSSFLHGKWSVIGAIFSSLFGLLGGGSHASAFLALVLLHPQPSPRRTLFYSWAAAVTITAQSVALWATPWLMKQGQPYAFVLPILCCLTAALLTKFLDVVTTPANGTRTPLLSPRPDLIGSNSQTLRTPVEMPTRPDIKHISCSALRSRHLISLGLLLAGISKSTRPLFKTYIQHRVGITLAEAQYLWSLRYLMSLGILGFILPAVFWLSKSRTSAAVFSLHTAKWSIVLMGVGAMIIGVADNLRVLVTGLVVNTLGCAMDISLLTVYAALVESKVASHIMHLASLESLGTLFGISTLYWAYQWSLGFSESWTGGLPYYLCATIYAFVACLIWAIKA